MNTNTDNVTLFTELVKQECKPLPGLLEFFVSKPTNIFDGENIEFDKVKAKRLTSLAKARFSDATENGTDNFSNVNFRPPIYKEARPYNIANFRKRIAGSNIYSEAEKNVLIMQKTAEDIAMLNDKIVRAELVQVAYLFQTGTIPFKTSSLTKEGVEDIDFEVPAANFTDLTGAAGSEYWDDADSDPIRDIEGRIRQVKKEGCTKVRDIIMGYSAMKYFTENSKIQSQLDNRRITRGEFLFNERQMNGFALLGNFNFAGDNVRVWSYEDYYLDPATGLTTTDYINPKNVIFIGDGDYQVYHAGIDIIKDINDPSLLSFLGTNNIRRIGDRIATSFYIDTYKGDRNSGVWLRLQKAPLYVPKTNDTFGKMQVLA